MSNDYYSNLCTCSALREHDQIKRTNIAMYDRQLKEGYMTHWTFSLAIHRWDYLISELGKYTMHTKYIGQHDFTYSRHINFLIINVLFFSRYLNPISIRFVYVLWKQLHVHWTMLTRKNNTSNNVNNTISIFKIIYAII